MVNSKKFLHWFAMVFAVLFAADSMVPPDGDPDGVWVQAAFAQADDQSKGSSPSDADFSDVDSAFDHGQDYAEGDPVVVAQNNVVRLKKKKKIRKRKRRRRRKRPKKPAVVETQEEGAIDLSTMDSTGSSASSFSGGARSPSQPVFKIYYDFLLYSLPGINDFTFGNFHSYLFLDIIPNPDLMFSFDVSSARGSPSFFELSYQWTPKFQLRFGKIWIPFDDLDPHNHFGGRTNVTELKPGTTNQFLPNLWTELGMGAKYTWTDSQAFRFDTHLYVVNGMADGGTDPLDPNGDYPNFADTGVLSRDNNRDKAIGGRAHMLIAKTFGLGVSGYTGQWDPDQATDPQRLTIYGVDSQVYLGWTEFRAGLISMKVDLLSATDFDQHFKRGGWYAELGQRFGTKGRWKILGRAGSLQLDDRVKNDGNDQQIVGGTLLYRPSLIQISLTHSRDLNTDGLKVNKSYTALRAVVEF